MSVTGRCSPVIVATVTQPSDNAVFRDTCTRPRTWRAWDTRHVSRVSPAVARVIPAAAHGAVPVPPHSRWQLSASTGRVPTAIHGGVNRTQPAATSAEAEASPRPAPSTA